jgi:GINS complex subunit 2
MAKLRAGVDILDAGGGVKMNGVGGMEIAEGRAFIGGVIDGLRKIGASKEQARRERETEERENGYPGTADEDEDML